ncbi:FecR family protein [Sphingomonas nostoxanthinifaciens]|uniref:FecR family protein n=1 Tax=Sphingomonas nostoxanthinifaciens TaxID=2872652 RepID=UPI001CC1CE58|nr:FecR domain-containing protein [Sphingomonas nostoxanthinifaciens]UAK22852.1 FecR domain-containing protein [Sphingomonas nostoxanthinifaciens]
MLAADDRTEREAIAWRLRVPTLDAQGWASFTTWLEADPAHSPVYDLVVRAEEDADRALHARRVEQKIDHAALLVDDTTPQARRGAGRAWMAAAAAMVAVLGGVWGVHGWQSAPSDRLIVTAPGETRALRLADGTLVSMNGDSRIRIASGDQRRVQLEQGEAAFSVVHHADRPFEVVVGATILRDVGTAFDVSRRLDGLDVAVAEGSVAYDPAGRNVLLVAGQAARTGASPGTLEVYDVDRTKVGSWKSGRLSYHSAPLAWVAIDIGRALGKRVTVDPDLAQRRFSGTIVVAKQGDVMRNRLEGLLDVTISSSPGEWQLKPPARAVH